MISEAPTGSQVHTVVGIDFAAVSRFNVGVEVQILRGVEVGAEAVFIPSAAKILRETRECQDFCVWGGYSRGSPTRLPFVFEMQYARPDAIAREV